MEINSTFRDYPVYTGPELRAYIRGNLQEHPSTYQVCHCEKNFVLEAGPVLDYQRETPVHIWTTRNGQNEVVPQRITTSWYDFNSTGIRLGTIYICIYTENHRLYYARRLRLYANIYANLPTVPQYYRLNASRNWEKIPIRPSGDIPYIGLLYFESASECQHEPTPAPMFNIPADT